MLTQKEIQAHCVHSYYDYAIENLKNGKEKVWRHCAFCRKERVYIRKVQKVSQ